MKDWLKIFFVYSVLGLLVYANSLNNQFLMDDQTFLGNPVMSQTKYLFCQWDPFREQALGVVDSREDLTYYRPMAHITYDLCYSVFKNDPRAYHLLNLFIFVLAVSLIYLLLYRMTGSNGLAFLTGLLYLVHPVNGIVVNYVSADVFALEVVCILSAILCLWEALERKNNRVLYALSLLSAVLSLFWHESGVMTPFYVSAAVLLLRKEKLKEKIFCLVPYFLIIAAYAVFMFLFFAVGLKPLKHMVSLHKVTAGDYLSSLFQVLTWYIGKLFYPKGIVMQWAAPLMHGHAVLGVAGLCSLLLAFVLLFIRFSRHKVLQLALVWFLTGFVPVLVASFLRPGNGAEIEPHWFIFSSIGFFILLAHCCLAVWERSRAGGGLLLFLLVLGLGAVSHAYNKLWFDQKTYSSYWEQQAPDLSAPYFYLGALYQDKDPGKAAEYYRAALEHAPSKDSYNNLWVIQEMRGDWKTAESNFRRASKDAPDFASNYNNLGIIYFNEGLLDRAEENFELALVYNPLLLQPRRSLAKIYLKYSQYQKAIRICLDNLRIVDDDTETLFLLVDISIFQKDALSAHRYAERLMETQRDPVVLTRLGILMGANDMPDAAFNSYARALHVAPDYKDAYLNLGTLLANLGKYDEAVHIWKLGLSIDPSDVRFKKDIEKAGGIKAHG